MFCLEESDDDLQCSHSVSRIERIVESLNDFDKNLQAEP